MNILVLYYSLYGNTFKMARAVAEGASSVRDAEVSIMRVPELLPLDLIEKNERIKNVRILQKEIPVARPDDLSRFHAILFGSPTRYGTMCGQMKNYLDQTAHLWTKGALEGKVAGVFTCGASPYGGYGSTLLSMVIPLLHLGMLVAGLPYTAKTEGGKPAGSPYGASAFVGQNADQPPVENDLHLARVLGHRVASIARQTVPRRAE